MSHFAAGREIFRDRDLLNGSRSIGCDFGDVKKILSRNLAEGIESCCV